jgi:hypothetical protein
MGKKFTAPENLQDLTGEELAAAVAEAFEAQKALRPAEGEEVSEEALAELRSIKEFVVAANDENAQRTEAAEARAAELAELDAAFEAAGAGAEAEAEATDAEATDAGAEAEVEVTDADAADVVAEAEAAAAEAAAPVAVANSRRTQSPMPKSFAARAAKNAPKSKDGEADRPTASLVAAANIPGVATGTKFNSFKDAADLIVKRLEGLPKNAPAGTVIRHGALQLELGSTKFSTANPEWKGKNVTEMINAAAQETRLPGGSLVAAGGWGAPSERSLEFCELESVEGLLTMPEVTFTRGGIEWTRGPVIADILEAAEGFWDMTEAVAEAGTEDKTSLRPELPTFESIRLDVVGAMMEAGLLLRQGWPELVQRYANLVMVAHQYKMSKKNLAQIQAITGAAKLVSNGFGNALDVLHILELIAAGERQRHLMSPKQTLEALIPFWLKAAIRADLAQRSGVDTITVTDAQIESHFTARNIKVQWLNAYQDLPIDGTSKLATGYPDLVEVIMYPAGTFVRGVSPVISFDAIYDSTNLKKNDYVHLFVEQGTTVANTCGNGLNIKFPLNINGRRAAFADANDNLFKAPVA